MRRLCVALFVVAMLAIPSVAAAYVGSLLSTDGGILGTGNWIVPGPTSFEWEVTQNADNSWHYSYVFTHPEGETSHFILEVSDGFTADEVFNLQGAAVGNLEVGLFEIDDPGNPGMPASMYGIKFDDLTGLTTAFAFDSFRVPVWQDFYSKDGVAGGGINAAWNAGFVLADPTALATNGSIDYHVLAPDSTTDPIPEPTTLMLLGSGLLGSVAVLRRRRK